MTHKDVTLSTLLLPYNNAAQTHHTSVVQQFYEFAGKQMIITLLFIILIVTIVHIFSTQLFNGVYSIYIVIGLPFDMQPTMVSLHNQKNYLNQIFTIRLNENESKVMKVVICESLSLNVLCPLLTIVATDTRKKSKLSMRCVDKHINMDVSMYFIACMVSNLNVFSQC